VDGGVADVAGADVVVADVAGTDETVAGGGVGVVMVEAVDGGGDGGGATEGVRAVAPGGGAGRISGVNRHFAKIKQPAQIATPTTV
jgi:hypothetical protein